MPLLRKKAIGTEEINRLARALASETRQQILALLKEKPMDISTLATKLGQSEPNISSQIHVLERVGLVTFTYQPGNHGVRKVCAPAADVIEIVLHTDNDKKE